MAGRVTTCPSLPYLALAFVALTSTACQRDDRPAVAARPAPAPRRLGTPHPIGVASVGADGRWVLGCQARADTNGDGKIAVPDHVLDTNRDELIPYVFRHGVGDGERIDAFVDASRDGRWVVVVRDGTLTVIDLVSDREDALPDASVAAPNLQLELWARIDDAQRALIYVRKADPREVAIYDLVRHDVRIARAARPVVSIVPEPGAPWAVISLEPPPGVLKARRWFSPEGVHLWACGGSDYIPSTPSTDPSWLSLDSATLSPPSVIAHIDGQELTRGRDRAIRLGSTVIVPAACDAELHDLATHPLRIIAVCRRTRPAIEELFGVDLHATLAAAPTRAHRERDDHPFLRRLPDAAAYCSDDACFALADGHPIAVPGKPSSVYGPYIFSARGGDGLVVTDSRTGITTPLLPTVATHPRGDHVEKLGTLAVDLSLSPPRAIHVFTPTDYLVDDHGRILTGPAPDYERLPSGPLTWVEPTP